MYKKDTKYETKGLMQQILLLQNWKTIFPRKISFVTSFTISKRLKKYYLQPNTPL